jgi:hypothetical protein
MAVAALAADKPITPVGYGNLVAAALSHFGRIGLDLMPIRVPVVSPAPVLSLTHFL